MTRRRTSVTGCPPGWLVPLELWVVVACSALAGAVVVGIAWGNAEAVASGASKPAKKIDRR